MDKKQLIAYIIIALLNGAAPEAIAAAYNVPLAFVLEIQARL